MDIEREKRDQSSHKEAASRMAYIRLILFYLFLSWGHCVEAQTGCEFNLPSDYHSDACDFYYLTDYLTAQPFNISLNKDFNITFGFCQKVTGPKQCSSVKAGMAAYLYDGETCYGIGSNAGESTYTVSQKHSLKKVNDKSLFFSILWTP